MHSHKAKRLVERIDNYLPRTYTAEIINRCAKKHKILDLTDQYVKDVKRFKLRNPVVLEAILEFARENEKAQKKLEKHAIK